jgi:hypothetical protein
MIIRLTFLNECAMWRALREKFWNPRWDPWEKTNNVDFGLTAFNRSAKAKAVPGKAAIDIVEVETKPPTKACVNLDEFKELSVLPDPKPAAVATTA